VLKDFGYKNGKSVGVLDKINGNLMISDGERRDRRVEDERAEFRSNNE